MGIYYVDFISSQKAKLFTTLGISEDLRPKLETRRLMHEDQRPKSKPWRHWSFGFGLRLRASISGFWSLVHNSCMQVLAFNRWADDCRLRRADSTFFGSAHRLSPSVKMPNHSSVFYSAVRSNEGHHSFLQRYLVFWFLRSLAYIGEVALRRSV